MARLAKPADHRASRPGYVCLKNRGLPCRLFVQQTATLQPDQQVRLYDVDIVKTRPSQLRSGLPAGSYIELCLANRRFAKPHRRYSALARAPVVVGWTAAVSFLRTRSPTDLDNPLSGS